MNAPLTKTAYRCCVCGKLTTGRVAKRKAGDEKSGESYPRRHGRARAPCPGNFQPAQELEVPLTTALYGEPTSRPQATKRRRVRRGGQTYA